MSRIRIGWAALMCLLGAPASVVGQTVVGGGLAFHDEVDLAVGGYLVAPLGIRNESMSFAADFGLYFPDQADRDYLEFNANLLYHFRTQVGLQPFVLGGANIARDKRRVSGIVDSDIRTGLNLGAGVALPIGALRPMAGAKLEIGGGKGFVVFGGIGFSIDG